MVMDVFFLVGQLFKCVQLIGSRLVQDKLQDDVLELATSLEQGICLFDARFGDEGSTVFLAFQEMVAFKNASAPRTTVRLTPKWSAIASSRILTPGLSASSPMAVASATGDRVLLDVADSALVLAFRARPIEASTPVRRSSIDRSAPSAKVDCRP